MITVPTHPDQQLTPERVRSYTDDQLASVAAAVDLDLRACAAHGIDAPEVQADAALVSRELRLRREVA